MSLLGDFGDFFMGTGQYADPKAINPAYGVPQSDVRQAAINQLGNVSALLLAAGQPMSGGQRGQILAQIGGAGSGFNTDLLNASQRRLMQGQMQEKQAEQQELAVIRERQQKDPDGLATAMGIAPELVRSASASDLRQIAKQIAVTRATRDPLQQENQRLQNDQLKTPPYSITRGEDGSVIAVNPRNPSDFKVVQGGFTERPLTPEEKQAFSIPPNSPAVMTKTGPKILSSGGTTVNVGDKAGSAAANKIIEGAYGEVDAAKGAVGNMQITNQIRGLMDEGVITGFGAGGRVLLGNAASAAGFTQNDQRLANTFALTSQLAQRTLAQAEKMKGALSDKDIAFLQQASGGTIALPESAIRMILDLSDKTDRMALQRGQRAAQDLRDIPAIKEAGLGRMLDVPEPQSYEKQITVEGQNMTARLGIDGKYYVTRNGKRFRVED